MKGSELAKSFLCQSTTGWGGAGQEEGQDQRKAGRRRKDEGLWEAECQEEMLLGDHLCFRQTFSEILRVTNGSEWILYSLRWGGLGDAELIKLGQIRNIQVCREGTALHQVTVTNGMEMTQRWKVCKQKVDVIVACLFSLSHVRLFDSKDCSMQDSLPSLSPNILLKLKSWNQYTSVWKFTAEWLRVWEESSSEMIQRKRLIGPWVVLKMFLLVICSW